MVESKFERKEKADFGDHIEKWKTRLGAIRRILTAKSFFLSFVGKEQAGATLAITGSRLSVILALYGVTENGFEDLQTKLMYILDNDAELDKKQVEELMETVRSAVIETGGIK